MTPVFHCGVCGDEVIPRGPGTEPKWCPKHRNTRAARPQKRTFDKVRYERLKKRCRCGALHSGESERCRDCIAKEANEKREQIVRLWAKGLSLRRIARELGTTEGSLGVQIVQMRKEGYDLPYRYVMENGVRVG